MAFDKAANTTHINRQLSLVHAFRQITHTAFLKDHTGGAYEMNFLPLLETNFTAFQASV